MGIAKKLMIEDMDDTEFTAYMMGGILINQGIDPEASIPLETKGEIEDGNTNAREKRRAGAGSI